MRSLRLLLMLALATLLVAGSGCMVRSKTLDAMLRAADAFKRKDYAAFEKYVDVESLIGQCVDITVGEIRERSGIFGSLVDGAGRFAKPKVVSMTRNQFKRLFETGYAQSQVTGLDALPSSELLFKLVSFMGIPEEDDAYEIEDVNKTDQGEVLKLKINLGDTGNPNWLPLHLQSKKAGDHVRITQVVNLKDIFRRVLKEKIRWL